MKKPKVSIVLPFFNAQRFLAESIESVLASTLDEFELVLVNDGSTDGGDKIAFDYEQKDLRVKVVHQSHQGIAAALNKGIEVAKADLVARMDSDDVSMPQRFAVQWNELSADKDVVMTSCLVEPIWEGEPTEGTKRYLDWVNQCLRQSELSQALYQESPFPHPTVIFRKRHVERLGGYREYDGPEDYDLWLRMAEKGMQFSKVPEVLLRWRICSKSLSRMDSHYRQHVFRTRKWEFLAHQIRTGKLAAGSDLWIWGAGRHGGQMWRFLLANGIQVHGFVDISPKKIGSKRQGLPVESHLQIPYGRTKRFYIGMVGSWDARPFIRSVLNEKGKTEIQDYVIL